MQDSIVFLKSGPLLLPQLAQAATDDARDAQPSPPISPTVLECDSPPRISHPKESKEHC